MIQDIFFGYKKVKPDEKQALVNSVFSSVATKYDIMNDVMSLGIHRLWKHRMMDEVNDFSKKLLDVAGGTGDIAKRFYNKAVKLGFDPDITIADINTEMLQQGRNKFIDKGIVKDVKWVCCNAESMSFADNSFDYYTCAFGMRNMTNLDAALGEAYRVLKPNGKFICLEFSHVSNDHLSSIYDFYSINLIPHLGKIIANDQQSYQYLVESIRKFPTQSEFADMIKKTGFSLVNFQNLTGEFVPYIQATSLLLGNSLILLSEIKL